MEGRILVVDDEDTLRLTLKARLTSGGFEVETARDGEEALEKLKASLFDVVLLDINMPRMDGITTLGVLAELYPKIDVIMLTGFADFSTAIECLKAGAKDYLVKPIDTTELITRMRSLLRAHVSERALEDLKKEHATAVLDELMGPITYSYQVLGSLTHGAASVTPEHKTMLLQRVRDLMSNMIEKMVAHLDPAQFRSGSPSGKVLTHSAEQLLADAYRRSESLAQAGDVKLSRKGDWQKMMVACDGEKIGLALENLLVTVVTGSDSGATVVVGVEAKKDKAGRVSVAVSSDRASSLYDRVAAVVNKSQESITETLKTVKPEDWSLLVSRRLVELDAGSLSVTGKAGKDVTVTCFLNPPNGT